MRSRYLMLALLVIFCAAQSSAAVYGTFPYELEKTSDELSTELRLGVVNAGNQTLQMEFSVPESDTYNVSTPVSTLDPGEIVRDPQGENWKYLGNGKYAEIRVYTFPVEISRYRDSNRIDIPLQVTASPAEVAEGGSTNPVSQVTTHNYTVLLDPALRPLERETQMEKEVRWEDTDAESLPEDWQEGRESPGNGSEDYKSNQSEQDTGEGEKSGVNTVTMILVVAIAACSLYLAKVI